MNLKRIAVVGAGNGGHAVAADLTLAGISVNLFEFVEFADNLQPIRRAGGVEISGVARKGFAKLNLATTNLEEAIDGVSHIMVVTQSLAHERLAQELTKKLQERQAVRPGLRCPNLMGIALGWVFPWRSLSFMKSR